MPNVMTYLKQEITRLARKEVHAAFLKLKKDKIAANRRIVVLRREVALLKKGLHQQARELANKQDVAAPAEETGKRIRITAKGVRAMRRKLRLSQAAFAKLLDVSSLTVFKWEKKNGKIDMRSKAREAFLRVRGIGAKEAQAALESSSVKKPARKARKARRNRR